MFIWPIPKNHTNAATFECNSRANCYLTPKAGKTCTTCHKKIQLTLDKNRDGSLRCRGKCYDICRLASFVISNDICNVINTGLCHHCISGMLSVTHFSRAPQQLLMEQMITKLSSCLRSSKYFSTDLTQIIYAKWCNHEQTNTYFD